MSELGTVNSGLVGVWYAHNYQAEHGDRWRDEYRNGFANPAYWTRTPGRPMSWQVKPGCDAAAAIQDWLKGLTIAECASVLVAIQLNTLRATVGDRRFNQMFSTLGGQPERGLLNVDKDWTRASTAGFIQDVESDQIPLAQPEGIGNRPVKRGTWYSFCNHPKYLLKHPEARSRARTRSAPMTRRATRPSRVSAWTRWTSARCSR